MKKYSKLIVFCISIFFILLIFNNVIAVEFPTFAIIDSKKEESSSISTVSPVFNFSSKSQILIETSTGKIIYENNADEKLAPASVTKVMTLLLIMDEIDNKTLNYNDLVVCSKKAASMGGSQIWFEEGESLTVKEALKCICVVSANDVCVAMAEKISGNEESFVIKMNEKAKDLGMQNTCFKNCHGIDEEGHYSCARDIAKMSQVLITKHPEILEFTSIWSDSIRNGKFVLNSTNKLLKSYEGLNGLKTGSTSKAGFNLSASATRDNLSLIAVVMKAESSAIRNDEVTELLNFGFANYKLVNLVKKGDVIEKIKVNKSVDNLYEVKTIKDENYVVAKSKDFKFNKEVEIYSELKAPISANTLVGKIKYISGDDNVFFESNIYITEDVKKSKYIDYLRAVFNIFLIKNNVDICI